MIKGFGAFRHGNFRTFFYGQSLAVIGTWVQTTAMSWLVYRLSESAFLLGLTGFALGAVFSATGKLEMGVILMGLGLMFQVISLVRLKRAKTRGKQ